jgi:hypothetical protein
MPPIKPGETITTTVPRLDITPTRDVPLPGGDYTFELIVEDEKGKKSPPVNVRVVVQKTLPDAVLKAPEFVEENATFSLDGASSTAVSPARLAKYYWRLADVSAGDGPGGPAGSDKI